MEQGGRIDPGRVRQSLHEAGLDPDRLPQHIAVIMDGNGRWAKARGLPRLAGHRAGTEALRRLLEGVLQFGIPYLTIYAFSTENWKRPPHEVRGLMFLLEDVIERQLDELDANGVRLRHIGWMDRIPPHLAEAVTRAVERTAANDQLTLAVALDYGGRQEIVRAVRRIVEAGIAPERIDEACLEAHMQTADMPDPDLIIRTSGEMRLSNFLLWQAAYSEFYSTHTLWPDFGRDALVSALADFARRERRFGGRMRQADRHPVASGAAAHAPQPGRSGG